MELKEFERYLELRKLKDEHYKTYKDSENLFERVKFEYNEELYILTRKLKEFIFEDESCIDKTLLKMKVTLNNLGSVHSGYGSYCDPGKALNEIKAVREILNVIDMLEKNKNNKE